MNPHPHTRAMLPPYWVVNYNSEQKCFSYPAKAFLVSAVKMESRTLAQTSSEQHTTRRSSTRRGLKTIGDIANAVYSYLAKHHRPRQKKNWGKQKENKLAPSHALQTFQPPSNNILFGREYICCPPSPPPARPPNHDRPVRTRKSSRLGTFKVHTYIRRT